MKAYIGLICIFASVVASAQNEYHQPSIGEIRARQAAAAGPKMPDPFTKMMVEIVIPKGIEVFIDPVSGCQYFVIVEDGQPKQMLPRMKNQTVQMCE